MEFFHIGRRFEIDDDWWRRAGMNGFTPKTLFYRVDESAFSDIAVIEVSVEDVEPLDPASLKRSHDVFNDGEDGRTAEQRVVCILRGFVSDTSIPPVEVRRQPKGSKYAYALMHGAHRFYCSVSAGFEYVPAVELPDYLYL